MNDMRLAPLDDETKGYLRGYFFGGLWVWVLVELLDSTVASASISVMLTVPVAYFLMRWLRGRRLAP